MSWKNYFDVVEQLSSAVDKHFDVTGNFFRCDRQNILISWKMGLWNTRVDVMGNVVRCQGKVFVDVMEQLF